MKKENKKKREKLVHEIHEMTKDSEQKSDSELVMNAPIVKSLLESLIPYLSEVDKTEANQHASYVEFVKERIRSLDEFFKDTSNDRDERVMCFKEISRLMDVLEKIDIGRFTTIKNWGLAILAGVFTLGGLILLGNNKSDKNKNPWDKFPGHSPYI